MPITRGTLATPATPNFLIRSGNRVDNLVRGVLQRRKRDNSTMVATFGEEPVAAVGVMVRVLVASAVIAAEPGRYSVQ